MAQARINWSKFGGSLSWKELNKMSESELKPIVSQLVRQANQRARRLQAKAKQDSSFYSPELKVFRDRKKPFTTRNKDVKQLRSEYKNVIRFLQAKTSTIKGSIKYQNDVNEKLGLTTTDKDYISDFWELTHKLIATPQFNQWLAKNGYKYDQEQVIKFIQNNTTNISDIKLSMRQINKVIKKELGASRTITVKEEF